MSSERGPLGRLQKVDIRSVWPTEDGHFTKWLEKAENLRLLGEDLRLDLDLIATEEAVGPFSADVVCVQTDDDSVVVIENQFGRTDHDHLGKLLTYAAGLEARTMIWVSERFTEEHRAAIDMLNNSSTEGFNYFGIEIEVLSIGDSEPAPRFNVVCQPNWWSSSTKRSVQSRRELTPTGQHQFEFWTVFREYMEQQSTLMCHAPQARAYMDHPLGRTGFQLSSVYSSWNSTLRSSAAWELRAELYLKGPNAKAHFGLLRLDSEAIEQEFGGELAWYTKEGIKHCRVYVQANIDAEFDRVQWPEHCEWLKAKLERLRDVLAPRIQKLDVNDWVEDSLD